MGGSLSKQSQDNICGQTVTQRKIIIWTLISGLLPGERQQIFTYYEKRCLVDIDPAEDLSQLMVVEPELCSRQVMETVNADLKMNGTDGW
jgi:hypothetical protein